MSSAYPGGGYQPPPACKSGVEGEKALRKQIRKYAKSRAIWKTAKLKRRAIDFVDLNEVGVRAQLVRADGIAWIEIDCQQIGQREEILAQLYIFECLNFSRRKDFDAVSRLAKKKVIVTRDEFVVARAKIEYENRSVLLRAIEDGQFGDDKPSIFESKEVGFEDWFANQTEEWCQSLGADWDDL